MAIICSAIGIYGIRLRWRLEKYDFENRSGGGVVGHESLGKAVRHGLKKKIAIGMCFALVPAAFSAFMFIGELRKL
jgi:hypothetical protein